MAVIDPWLGWVGHLGLRNAGPKSRLSAQAGTVCRHLVCGPCRALGRHVRGCEPSTAVADVARARSTSLVVQRSAQPPWPWRCASANLSDKAQLSARRSAAGWPSTLPAGPTTRACGRAWVSIAHHLKGQGAVYTPRAGPYTYTPWPLRRCAMPTHAPPQARVVGAAVLAAAATRARPRCC